MNIESAYKAPKIEKPKINLTQNEMTEALFSEEQVLNAEIQDVQNILENKSPNEKLKMEDILSIKGFSVFFESPENQINITEGQLAREYFYSTGEEKGLQDLTPEQKINLEIRCILRLYLAAQNAALTELQDIRKNMTGEYGEQYGEKFQQTYLKVREGEYTKKRLITLQKNLAGNETETAKIQEKIKAKEGRSVWEYVKSQFDDSDQNLLLDIEVNQGEKRRITEAINLKENLSTEQDNFRKTVRKQILRENISALRLGHQGGTDELKDFTKRMNQESFNNLLLTPEARKQVQEDMKKSFNFIEDIISGEEIKKNKTSLNQVQEMLKAGQDKNKITEKLIEKSADGMQTLNELCGGPEAISAIISAQAEFLKPYKTSEEKMQAKQAEILDKVQQVYAVLQTPENQKTFQKTKTLVDIAANYKPDYIDQNVTLKEVIQDSNTQIDNTIFTESELNQNFTKILQETESQYNNLTDNYFDKLSQTQQELILDQYLGIQTNDRFGHDGSLRAKTQDVLGGTDPFRWAKRNLPFGKLYSMDMAKLNSYEERSESFRESQDEIAKQNGGQEFMIEELNEAGEINSVEKKWGTLSEVEKELICQRECQQGFDEAYIGTDWEKMDQKSPFISSSAQLLIADIMVCKSAKLTKAGYSIVKYGGKMILKKSTGGLLFRNTEKLITKTALKSAAKEMINFSPRITLAISKTLSKAVGEKLVSATGKFLGKAAAKLGLKTSIAAGSNAVPIAGQIVSAGFVLMMANDAYEIGKKIIDVGRITDATERLQGETTSMTFDQSTQAFLDLYLEKNLPPNATEQDESKCVQDALDALPQGSYTLKNGNTSMQYFISNGEPQKVILTEAGQKTELTMEEVENLSLEDIEINSTDAIKLEAGFTQLKIDTRSPEYIEISRYDNNETLHIKTQKGNYFIEEYPDLKFPKQHQAVLFANLANKITGIYQENQATENFQPSGQEIELNDGYIFDTTYLSAENMTWYEKQLGISSTELAKALNQLCEKNPK